MAQYSGLIPPSNSKLGDIYTNINGQKFVYIRSNTGQPGRKLVKDTPKTILKNPDFGTTIQEGNDTYGFITNPKTGQKEKVNLKYENERTQAYLEQQNRNKDAIIDAYERGIIKGGVSNNSKITLPSIPSTLIPKTNTTNINQGALVGADAVAGFPLNNSGTLNLNIPSKTAPTTPTTTPTKKTTTTKRTTPSVQATKADTTQFGVAPEGWTQEDWNNSMAMYKADSEYYYDTQRNKPVGNGKTQDQVFVELFNQYATNPTSFNQAQSEQLLELSKKLGYAYGYKTGNPEDHKQREAGYTSNGIQDNNTAEVNNTPTVTETTTTVNYETPANTTSTRGYQYPRRDTTGYYSGQNNRTIFL